MDGFCIGHLLAAEMMAGIFEVGQSGRRSRADKQTWSLIASALTYSLASRSASLEYTITASIPSFTASFALTPRRAISALIGKLKFFFKHEVPRSWRLRCGKATDYSPVDSVAQPVVSDTSALPGVNCVSATPRRSRHRSRTEAGRGSGSPAVSTQNRETNWRRFLVRVSISLEGSSWLQRDADGSRLLTWLPAHIHSGAWRRGRAGNGTVAGTDHGP